MAGTSRPGSASALVEHVDPDLADAAARGERLGSFILAFVRTVLYLGLTLPLMPVQALFVALKSPLAVSLPVRYHRLVTRLLGFQILVTGTPSQTRPTLFVSNHGGYIDIEILSAVLPASFISKAEVASWPLFGWLAKLQRTAFVDRRRSSLTEQKGEIETRLQAGDDLILFPEGTSNDGQHVLPFKSALFSVANLYIDGRPLTVQPVSIAYTRLDGIPLGRGWRPLVAWYGDMELAQHAWRLAGLGKKTVEVHFHRPLSIAEFGSRKLLAQHCGDVVADGVAALLSGRLPEQPPPDRGAGGDSLKMQQVRW